MDYVDHLAVEIVCEDELINAQEARYLYVSFAKARRAFYRARAAIRYNITTS